LTTHQYVVLDVFTDKPLQGNPLAVFADADSLSGEEMQALARELNLSETAFLLPAETEADVRVRIFTPVTELPFAGHPVLGTAFLVAEQAEKDAVTLQTGAGVVPVELTRRDNKIVFGEMEQPLPTTEEPPPETQLLDALGIAGSELPVRAYRNGPLHVFVALESEDAVTALKPHLSHLVQLAPCCVSCFAPRSSRPQVRTRVFCPALGVAEDPATGSAAGPLALHLVSNGYLQFGEQLTIHQGEEIGRPSVLFARADGTPDHVEAIKVGGSAVEVAQGQYRVA
jgi:trans-2,3-dihydro-3-hydroxyanthranilate isomerase